MVVSVKTRRRSLSEFTLSLGTRRLHVAIVLVCVLSLSACANLGYYAQAIEGHFELMSARQDLGEVIGDQTQPKRVRNRLALVPEILEFAATELALPDNGSYRDYADIGRPAVTWVVFRTPEYSLDLKRSCFPVAGCLSYQGWFQRSAAEAAAERFRREGEDVYVAPSPAYSSLGWFEDPVLNTMLRWDESTFIGVIFHELTHQRLYVADDSDFNESLARFLEEEGVRRFLTARGDLGSWDRYLARNSLRQMFKSLVMEYRATLAEFYRQAQGSEELARGKRQIIQTLKAEYQRFLDIDNRWAAYQHWFNKPINNAQLAAVSVYNRYVPAFRALLRQVDGDIGQFWLEVDRLAAMSAKERADVLAAISVDARR